MKTIPQNRIGNYRWRICALIFFATTINYLDRQVISLLKDDYLEPLFNWTESDYANIVISFQVAYALGMVLVGNWIDRLGTKTGYSLSISIWSLAAILHAFAKSTFGFGMVRALLGFSEAGNYPAAIKATAEWFPKKERALATGILNSGANVGAILAPLTVPLIAINFGWEWAFIITGLIGFVWLLLWLPIYRLPQLHPKVKKAELDYIQSDLDDDRNQTSKGSKIPWIRLFRYKPTWAFLIGKFLTDPVWWFFLFWLPSFLNKEYGLTKTDLALPIAVVYTIATIGSIMGGWISGRLIRSGMAAYQARKTSLLLFAILVLPIIFAQYFGSMHPWFAVALIGLATASHQAWSANLFTTVSDIFPKNLVASIIGIGGMAGAIGGIFFAKSIGLILDHFIAQDSIQTGYFIAFIFSGVAYLLAWLIMHFLVPKAITIKAG